MNKQNTSEGRPTKEPKIILSYFDKKNFWTNSWCDPDWSLTKIVTIIPIEISNYFQTYLCDLNESNYKIKQMKFNPT